jgi:hypothetical protein
MTTETTQQITPPSPVAPPTTSYKPQWAVYVYVDRAYITYNGRLVATETCPTAAQEDRLVAVRDRLNHRDAAH